MKSIKHKILSVLLFTFAFFVMHDYIVVVDHHADFKSKVYHMENDNTFVAVQAHIHEAIHTILAFNCETELSIETKLLDVKPSVLPFSLISHVNLVPQRPPLT
ncbi:MAG: hypothetical protein COB99_00305 [Sulfurimonas sp.]|nr:MAG: hypothetical protein COB99_00305 [Sulfurimonas sp.]